MVVLWKEKQVSNFVDQGFPELSRIPRALKDFQRTFYLNLKLAFLSKAQHYKESNGKQRKAKESKGKQLSKESNRTMSLSQRRVNIVMGDLAFDTIGSLRVECAAGELGHVVYCENPDSNAAECWTWGAKPMSYMFGCEEILNDPSAEDTWELLKACGLVDEEMAELIDQQIYENEGLAMDDGLTEDQEWCGNVSGYIQGLWDEHEMANEMEKFETEEALHELLSAVQDTGVFMVPDDRTLLPQNKEWASMWCGEPIVDGEYPFTTKMLDRSVRHRPEHQDMCRKTVNKIDQQNRMIVDAEMTQFGMKYHTAKCEFGRIHVPLKFNRYLKNIGRPMKMMVRVKEADRKHPLSCIKVL